MEKSSGKKFAFKKLNHAAEQDATHEPEVLAALKPTQSILPLVGFKMGPTIIHKQLS
jgi:hypothetical protein